MNYQEQLTAAFPARDIEWRVGQEIKGKGDKPYAMVFAYVTSRAIMNRLDQVFGIGGWRDEYEVLSQGVVCRLSCLIDGEWITKTDAAPFTDIESLKGGFSDALKRAGVKFGIGRYLYDLPRSQVPLLPEWTKGAKFHRGKDKQNYYWLPPDLPEWAVPPANPLTLLYDKQVQDVQAKHFTGAEIIAWNKLWLDCEKTMDCKKPELIEAATAEYDFLRAIDLDNTLAIMEDNIYTNPKAVTNARKKYPNRIVFYYHMKARPDTAQEADNV
jgi:hypothetical protein